MPEFEVHGFGRETGRRRKRIYFAINEDAAINMASEDGTITESVIRLQPTAASDRQKAYAKALGIEFLHTTNTDNHRYRIQTPDRGRRLSSSVKQFIGETPMLQSKLRFFLFPLCGFALVITRKRFAFAHGFDFQSRQMHRLQLII
jgi:hypothetical protein